MTYSRDEVASELLSYYDFLVGMYLSPDNLKRPPPRGWPEITKERLASLGKTDAVVDLLRHLPYIDGDEYPLPHIYEMCICNDYRSDDFRTSTFTPQDKFPYEPPLEYGAIEPHVAVIARFHGPNGWNIYCNTLNGEMTLMNYMFGIHDVFESAKGLCAKLREDMNSLSMVPVGSSNVVKSRKGNQNHLRPIQEAYHAHGWSTSQFRKDQCLQEVKRLDDAYFGFRPHE